MNYLSQREVNQDTHIEVRNLNARAASWSPPKLPSHLQDVEQDNPELIKHIREYWIIPPIKH